MRSRIITSSHKSARIGEQRVARWLTQRGFQILETYFRRKALELDVVAIKGQELLIIEVKTRHKPTDDWQQLIPPRKLQALWRGADRFLAEHPELGACTVHMGLALVQQEIAWMRLPPIEKNPGSF